MWTRKPERHDLQHLQQYNYLNDDSIDRADLQASK